MKIQPEHIFTAQGKLEDVEKKPNIEFVMNVFNIPRAFGVSGFGENWNVGKHSFATAIIALYWAKLNKFSEERKNRFVVLALLHDVHEAATGDILPMLKTQQIKNRLDRLQENVLAALGVKLDASLKTDLKIVDLIAFLYEIKQVSPNILHTKKLNLANAIAARQLDTIFSYCDEHKIPKSKVKKFLAFLEIE